MSPTLTSALTNEAPADSSRTQSRTTARSTARPKHKVEATLRKRDRDLLLELEEPSDVCRIVIVASFTSSVCFKAWCDRDPLRFSEPLLQQQLHRQADEIWQSVK